MYTLSDADVAAIKELHKRCAEETCTILTLVFNDDYTMDVTITALGRKHDHIGKTRSVPLALEAALEYTEEYWR